MIKRIKRISQFVLLFAGFLWSFSPSGTAKPAGGEVVVYTSVDQVFAETILKNFEKETGIRIKAVYDVEATKTTGLVNRLIAEQARPKCDVFWNSEFARTIALKERGILVPYFSPSALDIPAKFKDPLGYWTGFAARARVLVYNTKLVQESEAPRSIFDLTAPKWKGKVALAYPLFGTTATHVSAWYAALGKEKTEQYLTSLKENEVVIVDGNSTARDLVAQGTIPLAFTDTDDVNVGLRAGKPIQIIYPDQNDLGTLLIPNTVALIKNAPHPEEAKRFVDYLLSREIESKLAFLESAQIPVRSGVKKPPHVPDISQVRAMNVDYDEVARHMDEAARFTQNLFVR